MYTFYPSYQNGGESIAVGEISLSKMSSYGGDNWSNRVSWIEIEPKCVFEGFRNKNFGGQLGTWKGLLDSKTSQELDPYYENDKMKSFKCKCQETFTCEDQYTYNFENPKNCLTPDCNIARIQLDDAWKKKVSYSISTWAPRSAFVDS